MIPNLSISRSKSWNWNRSKLARKTPDNWTLIRILQLMTSRQFQERGLGTFTSCSLHNSHCSQYWATEDCHRTCYQPILNKCVQVHNNYKKSSGLSLSHVNWLPMFNWKIIPTNNNRIWINNRCRRPTAMPPANFLQTKVIYWSRATRGRLRRFVSVQIKHRHQMQ